MRTRHRLVPAFLLVLCVAALWLCAMAAPRAQAPSRRALLQPIAGALRDHPARGPKPRRVHQAAVQVDVFRAADGSSAAPTVDLNLFDDVDLVAEVDQYEARGPASFLWHGRLQGLPQGHATFVSTDGIIAGTVFADGVVYEVGYAGDGVYDVKELDPAAFPTDDPPEQFDLTPVVQPDASSPAVAADTAAQIDVLVVWTPAAETAAGGLNAMRSLVDLSVANANTAYANSGISTRLRLVYKAQVPYTESTISTDLSRLMSTGDGYIDTVHGLRDQYGADIVSLIGTGYTSNSGACGIGYLMSYVSTSFASTAFNVVDYSCAAGNLSYAHEVGHNEGMHHDPANASSPGAYSYSYGYVDPGCAFKTVMAYGGCTRVMQFSSPGISYGGKVTGTATQNNALTLNNTAATVANFRQAVTVGCTYALSSSSWTAPSGGGSSSVGVTVTGTGCGWTATSNAAWVTITSGASGSGNGTVTFTVQPNSTTVGRAATLTIAGHTFTVTQAAPCTSTVSPLTLSVAAAGGSYPVSVTSGAGCGWTAVSGAAWVTVASGASGTGNGTVSLTVKPNLSTSSSRSGSVTIAGKTLGVSQAAASPVVIRTFTASRAYPLTTGQLTTWTASASGGATSLEYQFWRYSGLTRVWTMVRDYAPGNAFAWTPAPAETGSWALQVWVRQTGSTAGYEAWAGTGTFNVVAPVTGTPVTVSSFRPNMTLPRPAGTTITWTATASGGSGPLEYEFWVYDGSSWKVGRGYASGNQFAWTPSVAGTYSLQVWVRQVGVTLSYQAWLGSGSVSITSPSSPLTTATPVTSVTLSADRTLPVSAGTTVTWTALANGTGPEYSFWLYNGVSWSNVQPYGPSRTFAWTPLQAGTYALQVWARHVGSTASYEAWVGSGSITVVP